MKRRLDSSFGNENKMMKILSPTNSASCIGEGTSVIIYLDVNFSSEILRKSFSDMSKQFHYYYCLLRFSKHFPGVIRFLEEERTCKPIIRKFPHDESNTHSLLACEDSCKIKESVIDKFIEWAVEQNGACILYLNHDKKLDANLVRKALKTYPPAINIMNNFDEEVYMEMIKNKYDIYRQLPQRLKSNRDLTLEAVKHYGLSIEFADSSLKDDREIALEAVRNCGRALDYCSERLKNDRELVLEAVKKNSSAFSSVQQLFNKDREIIKEVIKSNGSCISYVHVSLLKDKDFVLELIKLDNEGVVFSKIDENLLKDREILIEAIKKNPDAFKYADEELKNNRELLIKSFSFPITTYCNPFQYLEHLRSDKEIILKYLKNNRNGLSQADATLLNSRDFILDAVKVRGSALLSVKNQSFLEDEEIVREALKTEPNIFMYINPRFQSNKEFARLAIKTYPNAFKYVDKSLSNDPSFVLESIKENPQVFQYTDLKMDNDFVIKAAGVNLKCLKYSELNFSKELVLKIFENSSMH